MIRRFVCAAALAGLLAAFACGVRADGTPPPPPSPPPDMSTVTVHGARDPEKLRELVADFVGAITSRAHSDEPARWYVPICPLVAGLSRERGEYFLQRISDAARAAGAPLAPEKCGPNLIVVVTGNPQELLERWRDKSPLLFSKARGPFAVKQFMRSTLPVRAWYDAGDDCASRMATFEMQADVLSVACRSSGMASRLSRSSVRTMSSAIIVVDNQQIKGLKVGQVADYVAMLALAELVEPKALLPVPTVLNLFVPENAGKAPGLSDWDQWYLKALYDSNPRNSRQVSEIRVEMFRAAVAAEPPAQ